MRSEHTPGPWEINYKRGGIETYVYGSVFGEPIAMILDARREGEEEPDIEAMESNAHLIAAAPNLLKACKVGSRRTGDSGPEFLHKVADILSANGYNNFATDLRIKADREQNAITKAEGNTEGGWE